jgi:epoxyqueuosine reductase
MNSQLQNFLEEFFENSELNRLPKKYGGGRIFSSPLIGVASGEDPIFQKFKEVVGPEHLTPTELWLACGQKAIPSLQLRVVSIVFPYVKKIRDEGQNPIVLSKMILPAEIYSVGRNYANPLKKETCRQIIKFFKKNGFNAVAGMLSEVFTIITKGNFYSNWSERHIAFAAGLGTFSLHDGLITEVGCNIRLASVITDTPLEVTLRKSDDPYANCLYYVEGNCKECVEKCPAKVITENGHDKIKCYNYLQKVARKMISRTGQILKPHIRRVNDKLRSPVFPVGCALCQFGVPCMDKNPMASEEK